MATKEQIDAVIQRLKYKDVPEDGLDGAVHDAASSLASSVNNNGFEAQVEFLLDQGFTPAQILNMVED